MATMNINNNHGNITVADVIHLPGGHTLSKEDCEWELQVAESLANQQQIVSSASKPSVPGTQELEAKIDELTARITSLMACMDLLSGKEVIQ